MPEMIKSNIKFYNRTNKKITLLFRTENPKGGQTLLFMFSEEIFIEPHGELENHLFFAEEDDHIRYALRTECLLKEENISDDKTGRILLLTPVFDPKEHKEIEIHENNFTCEGRILPFPEECLSKIRCHCIKDNLVEYCPDHEKFQGAVDLSNKNPQDFESLETGYYRIGLINNSGKMLYAKVENRNCRKQLFFNLEASTLGYVTRDAEDAYITFSTASPNDPSSKTYLVLNNSNYLIDAELNLKPIGNGKVTYSEKHLDELTKDENEALRSSAVITEVLGPVQNIIHEEYPTLFARMQKKILGSNQKEFLFKNVRFIREPGEFKLEIFASIYNRKKGFIYKVQSGKRYQFTKKNELIDLETNSAIEPINESFFSDAINDDGLNINYNDPEQLKNIVYFENQIPAFKENEKFVDHYFPPEERIISSRDANGNHVKSHFNVYDVLNDDGKLDEANNEKNEFDEFMTKDSDFITFLRPAEIFDGEYYLFRNGIEPGDVKQGSLGDCWAISAIAALATRPELIMNIFKTNQKNSKGFYELFYYDAKGNKRLMFIDDNFLCVSGKPYFSRSDDKEIWALLMEKSLAKYEGGYSNLKGGNLENALYFWTGKTCTRYSRNYFSEKWPVLHDAIRSKFIVCAASIIQEGKSDKDESNGIYFGHAYSILDAKHYTKNGTDLQLVLLRNTWGQKEWQGDYSDNSTLWTDELKTFFNYDIVRTDNGIFWMNYEDFCQYFEYFTVCECADV